MLKKITISIFIYGLTAYVGNCENSSIKAVDRDEITICGDSIESINSELENDALSAIPDTIKRKGLLQRFIAYFGDANKEKRNKKFDINFIGGPHYASDTKFGIGLVGTGLYRMNGCSQDMQPSNVSLFSDVSTVGFYMLGIGGNNLFPEDKYRLSYGVYFYSFPSYYWGIGYDNGDNNDNKTDMKRFQSKVKAEFLIKIMNNLYVGPNLRWDFVTADDIDKSELLNGQPLTLRNYGIGATIQYDSRDLMNNASRGFYFHLDQIFRPKFLWNDFAFSTTDVKMSYYKQAWKGSVVAGQIAGTFNFGNPSWAMMAKLGDSSMMRGYYEGRYRDNHSLVMQVELRQHVWRRNGVVLWVGAGSVFHDSASFGHILPNYGVGYRWEFKKKVNVRLDWGFGRNGQNGFTFNINEAF